MGSYFLKIDKYFRLFFIIRSFGGEFERYLATSYLSSNIDNEGKTFNSSCNTEHRQSNFEGDICKRLYYFLPSTYSNCILFIPAMIFVDYRKRRKSKLKNIARNEKGVFFEKYQVVCQQSLVLWCFPFHCSSTLD